MSTASRGNAFENRVATWLEDQGYLVGGRRHRRGGGDLVAFKLLTLDHELLLVECKRTPRPWTHFGPVERAELAATAKLFGARAALAWSAGPTARIELRYERDWPG